MRLSKRVVRRERRYKGPDVSAMLPLVSLMDIFTILVFFLLVNSGDTGVLGNPTEVHLPESVAVEKVRESVVVMVTREQIFVQGRPVASIPAAGNNDDLVIPPLMAALREYAGPVENQQPDRRIASREVTILGDRDLPYRLLKRVMATCTAAEFGRMSLAVLQKHGADQVPMVAAL